MPTKQLISEELPQEEIVGQDIEYQQDFSFFPGGMHIYRQEGPYLVCRGCELHHAIYIGMQNIMVGVNDKGEPVIRKRSEL